MVVSSGVIQVREALPRARSSNSGNVDHSIPFIPQFVQYEVANAVKVDDLPFWLGPTIESFRLHPL